MLYIVDGSEPGMLTCTAVCQNIDHAYFSDQNGFDIHDINIDSIQSVLSGSSSSHNGENCTYSINISWTMNEQIRNALNSIHCNIVYGDGNGRVSVCRTGNISVIFTDIGNQGIPKLLLWVNMQGPGMQIIAG